MQDSDKDVIPTNYFDDLVSVHISVPTALQTEHFMRMQTEQHF